MDLNVVAISAVVGYAVGTIQILAIDWIRSRSKHRIQLRLLRSELRRLSRLRTPYNWNQTSGPPSDKLPRPPIPTTNFTTLVAQIDFYLTDESHDDNTQEGLLDILDGAHGLQHYQREIQKCLDEIRGGSGPATVNSWNRAFAFSQSYDSDLAKLQTIVASAIGDVDRRLKEASLWRQLNRPMGKLPSGENPKPLSEGDPRIINLGDGE